MIYGRGTNVYNEIPLEITYIVVEKMQPQHKYEFHAFNYPPRRICVSFA